MKLSDHQTHYAQHPTQARQLGQALCVLMADSFAIYVKTRGFHWNVEGPLLHTLQLIFEEQYTELASAMDLIAERVHALGVQVPSAFQHYAALTRIGAEPVGTDAADMLLLVAQAHEIALESARAAFRLASQLPDQHCLELVSQRIARHEKAILAVRSMQT